MRIPRRKGGWSSASWRPQVAALVVLVALLVVSLLQDSADLQAVARRLQEKLRADQAPAQRREIVIKNTLNVNTYIHHEQQQRIDKEEEPYGEEQATPSQPEYAEPLVIDTFKAGDTERRSDVAEEKLQQRNEEEQRSPAQRESAADAESFNDTLNGTFASERRSDVGEYKVQQQVTLPSSPAEMTEHQQQEEEGDDCEEDAYSSGEWVFDEARRPLYREEECGFLTEQVTCMRNGRRDDTYQKWRWQPRHRAGDLSVFHAALLLERLRNKRMMFVGDSLNRNQWESMVCLLQSGVAWDRKSLAKNGSLSVFRFHDYNATVEFYWAPFLVASNSDDPDVHAVAERAVAPTAIARHAAHWEGADVLVFNTYIWWMNTERIKVLRGGSFARRSARYDEMDRVEAYRKVLKTWSRWVRRRVDPGRTMVFFMSVSPVHMQGEGWGRPGAIKCSSETLPVSGNRTAKLEVGTDWRLFWTARKAARRTPAVQFVDVTAMSELRKDAHTSVHTLRQGKLLTRDQQAQPAKYADCIHWCLPGLPDTWNHIIYAHLLRRRAPNLLASS